MHEPVFDTSSIFRAFTSGKGQTVEDQNCRIHSLSFASEYSDFLVAADHDLAVNRQFEYLMVEPVCEAEDFDQVVALTHGLNEGSYAKLIPWAYNIALDLQTPVVLFPMAFHVTRRSSDWGFSPQVRVAGERAQIPGNKKSSPFNAQISQRIAEAPERFTRGGLQSYYDMIELSDRIRQGNHPACKPGARLDFLGYSAGGYLSLILMMANPGDRFTDSRCVVFASCAALEDMHPGSIFILDTEANGRLIDFLKSRRYEQDVYDAPVAGLVEEPAFWFSQIFFHGSALEDRLAALHPRLLAIAGTEDRVITAEGMKMNLSSLDVQCLPLGIHEFPFTLSGPLVETYDRRQTDTRELIARIKNSQQIPVEFQAAFGTFLREVRTFLKGL